MDRGSATKTNPMSSRLEIGRGRLVGSGRHTDFELSALVRTLIVNPEGA